MWHFLGKKNLKILVEAWKKPFGATEEEGKRYAKIMSK